MIVAMNKLSSKLGSIKTAYPEKYSYLLSTLVNHHAQSGEYSRLRILFCDQAWMHAQYHENSGTYSKFLEDLESTWQGLTAISHTTNQVEDYLIDCIAFALIKTKINSLAELYSPEYIVSQIISGEWGIERALEIIMISPNADFRYQTCMSLLETTTSDPDNQQKLTRVAWNSAKAISHDEEQLHELRLPLLPHLRIQDAQQLIADLLDNFAWAYRGSQSDSLIGIRSALVRMAANYIDNYSEVELKGNAINNADHGTAWHGVSFDEFVSSFVISRRKENQDSVILTSLSSTKTEDSEDARFLLEKVRTIMDNVEPIQSTRLREESRDKPKRLTIQHSRHSECDVEEILNTCLLHMCDGPNEWGEYDEWVEIETDALQEYANNCSSSFLYELLEIFLDQYKAEKVALTAMIVEVVPRLGQHDLEKFVSLLHLIPDNCLVDAIAVVCLNESLSSNEMNLMGLLENTLRIEDKYTKCRSLSALCNLSLMHEIQHAFLSSILVLLRDCASKSYVQMLALLADKSMWHERLRQKLGSKIWHRTESIYQEWEFLKY